MSIYIIIAAASLLVLVSYILYSLSVWIKIPHVLMLLICGLTLGFLARNNGISYMPDPYVLITLGIVGLIVIVLEGSLELKISKNKAGLITKAFIIALLSIVIASLGIAYLISWLFTVPIKLALINAIPLSVVSSAIAIPSAVHLANKNREFITYESVFSDIIGILFFETILSGVGLSIYSTFDVSIKVILIIVISIILSIGLIFFLAKVSSKTKIFPILAILILAYSIAHMMGLFPLILVFLFGILLNNLRRITPKKHIIKQRHAFVRLKEELSFLKSFIKELSFIIKTFFFILFGYSIQLSNLASIKFLTIGFVVFLVLIATRYIMLFIHTRSKKFVPELFIAPKGLITILMYEMLPSHLKLVDISERILFIIILASNIFILFGLKTSKDNIDH